MKVLRIFVLMTFAILAGGYGEARAAVKLTTLHQFGSLPNDADGANPAAGLIQGTDGNYYSTTANGGTNGLGTVFQITTNGTLTTLWQFGSLAHDADGANPYAGLVQEGGGTLMFYGTTSGGGTNGSGYGTVFRISDYGPPYPFFTLHTFNGNGDGSSPFAGLILPGDPSNDLYGTTFYGPAGRVGSVFRISANFPAYTLTTTYQFGSLANDADGANPYAGLVQGSDGYFYGVTEYGGNTNLNSGRGYGTVFQTDPGGDFTILHTFSGTDGGRPLGTLVQGLDGYLYGTTITGGSPNTGGTVFKISTNGPSYTLTMLYDFNVGDPTHGALPYGGLVQGSDGNFYGTTSYDGTNACLCGTVFRITTNGTLTTLYEFGGVPTDGGVPYGVLVQGIDGYFYGTTWQGGTNNLGTVFVISVPLGSPANQIMALQFAPGNCTITIPSVAGATYQLQFKAKITATNWANIGNSVKSTGGPLTLTDPTCSASQAQGFYQVQITP